jgi:hypothetical protein
MKNWLRDNAAESDGLGRDMELAEAFGALDPAMYDPNYWLRFRGWVMSNAATELGRRRLMTRLTVGDVMRSWARALVPTAVLAAAIAGVLTIRPPAVIQAQPIGLEEQLIVEIPGDPAPVLMTPDIGEVFIVFASESF